MLCAERRQDTRRTGPSARGRAIPLAVLDATITLEEIYDDVELGDDADDASNADDALR